MSDGFGDMLQVRAMNNWLNTGRDLTIDAQEVTIQEQEQVIQNLQGELDSLRKSFMALRDDRDEWQAREESTIETARHYAKQGVLDRDEFNVLRSEILAEKRVEVKNRNG